MPHFALYVKSVDGRMVPRYGTETLIGARRPRLTKAQRRAGEAVVAWNTDRVTPITHDEYRRYRRAYDAHLRDGDLLAVDEAAFTAWQRAEARREKECAAERARATDTADSLAKTEEQSS